MSGAQEPHLTRLGRWVATLKWDEIPDATKQAARFQILSNLAAMLAGSRSEEAASIGAAIRSFGGSGEASVFPLGIRMSPDHATLAHAAWSMTHDFDDIIWMGHTGHSAVFASLAVAEAEGAEARDLLMAVVVANEVAGRLGASSFLGPLNGQMWTFVHLVGAAAATSKLLGLDAKQTAHALAISLAQPNFALQPGFMTPTSKLLAAATPASTGLAAAFFAREGMTGALDILEDRRGFFKRFTFLPMVGMLEGLGEFWATETLAFKTFPGCHYFQTACSALEEILSRHGPLGIDRVDRVEIATTKLGVEVTRFASEYVSAAGEITPVSVCFDLKETAAVLLCAGRFTSAELEPRWLRENAAALSAWRAKISVAHDPALTLKTVQSARGLSAGREALGSLGLSDLLTVVRSYRREYASTLLGSSEVVGWVRALVGLVAGGVPKLAGRVGSALPLPFANRVTAFFSDGTQARVQVDLPVGSFCAPSARAELEGKLLREASPSLGEGRTRELLEAGLALGGDGGTLGRLLELTRA